MLQTIWSKALIQKFFKKIAAMTHLTGTGQIQEQS